MPVVVTGATGQLGRLVLAGLLEQGVAPQDLRAVGRDAARLDALDAELGVGTVQASYDAPQTLEAAFEDATTVLLISGSEAGRRIAQHRNAVQALAAAGADRVVYTSILHADRKAISLAAEHDATEELIAESRVPATLLRNGWYSENYLGALGQAATTGSFDSSVGEGLVASAARSDYAAAAVAALLDDSHAERTYELSGDSAWSQAELAAAFSTILGREIALRQLTGEEHAAALRSAGMDDGLVGFLVGLDASTRDGALADTTGDLSRLIGRPTTPLLDSLRAGHAGPQG